MIKTIFAVSLALNVENKNLWAKRTARNAEFPSFWSLPSTGISEIEHAMQAGAITLHSKIKVRWEGVDADGNLVVLDHGNGLVSRYGHNDTLLVKAGEEVLRGAPIARIGTTGRSSAPHLHFEVRREDEPLNPAYLLVSET